MSKIQLLIRYVGFSYTESADNVIYIIFEPSQAKV